MYFPLTAPLDILITTFAVIGFGICIVRRQLNGAALGVLGLVLVAGVYLAQDSLPVIGLLWNPRLLPFLYLVRYLLMMIGIYEVLAIGWNVVKDRRANAEPGRDRGGRVRRHRGGRRARRTRLHVPGVAVRRHDDRRRGEPVLLGPDRGHGDERRRAGRRVVELQLPWLRGSRPVLHRVLRRGHHDGAARRGPGLRVRTCAVGEQRRQRAATAPRWR